MKSCFCKLAIALYIDHEPFNTVRTPDLCRVVNIDEIESKSEDKNSLHLEEDYSTNPVLYLKKHKIIYKKLVKNAMDYISSRVSKINRKFLQFNI